MKNKALLLIIAITTCFLTACSTNDGALETYTDDSLSETQAIQETEPESTEPEETESTLHDFTYADLHRIEFWFGSGAGGWCTTMTIDEDGSFEGVYHDSEMGDTGDGYPNGTLYYCEFSGQLGELAKIDELTYSAEMMNISYKNTVGKEENIDGIHYIYSDAYGLDEAGTIYFYLSGTKKEDLTDDCYNWVRQAMYDDDYNPLDEFTFVCLYNKNGEEAFYSYDIVDNFLKNFYIEEILEQSYIDELEKLETQANMTENAYNQYDLWDVALNQEWEILMKILSGDEKEKLRSEEREWIKYKESEMSKAGSQAGGGSLQSMLEYNKGAEITKERVYELKEIIEEMK